MIGILLISHGELAKALLATAKMLYGAADIQVATIGLNQDESMEAFDSRIGEAFQSVNTGDGVYILVDLLGGTPCNRVATLASEDVNILTGMNLGMFLELVTTRDYGNIDTEEILTASKESIVLYNSLLNQLTQDEIL